MKKALITAYCGQDGTYLTQRSIELGYEVHWGRRRSSLDEGYRLRALGIENDMKKQHNYALRRKLNNQAKRQDHLKKKTLVRKETNRRVIAVCKTKG